MDFDVAVVGGGDDFADEFAVGLGVDGGWIAIAFELGILDRPGVAVVLGIEVAVAQHHEAEQVHAVGGHLVEEAHEVIAVQTAGQHALIGDASLPAEVAEFSGAGRVLGLLRGGRRGSQGHCGRGFGEELSSSDHADMPFRPENGPFPSAHPSTFAVWRCWRVRGAGGPGGSRRGIGFVLWSRFLVLIAAGTAAVQPARRWRYTGYPGTVDGLAWILAWWRGSEWGVVLPRRVDGRRGPAVAMGY